MALDVKSTFGRNDTLRVNGWWRPMGNNDEEKRGEESNEDMRDQLRDYGSGP